MSFSKYCAFKQLWIVLPQTRRSSSLCVGKSFLTVGEGIAGGTAKAPPTSVYEEVGKVYEASLWLM